MKGDPVEAIERRLEHLEKNVEVLRGKLQQTGDALQRAQQNRLRQQAALNKLLRTISEVAFSFTHHHHIRACDWSRSCHVTCSKSCF